MCCKECLQFINSSLIRSYLLVLYEMSSIGLFDVT